MFIAYCLVKAPGRLNIPGPLLWEQSRAGSQVLCSELGGCSPSLSPLHSLWPSSLCPAASTTTLVSHSECLWSFISSQVKSTFHPNLTIPEPRFSSHVCFVFTEPRCCCRHWGYRMDKLVWSLLSRSLYSAVEEDEKQITKKTNNQGSFRLWRIMTNFIFFPLQIPYYDIETLKSKLELVEYLQRKLFSQNAGICW